MVEDIYAQISSTISFIPLLYLFFDVVFETGLHPSPP